LDTSDREVIARVHAGDREAFHELVRRHAPPLWSTLRATLRNAEDARDVFQETWLRAFQRLDSLRQPERLRSWVLSIALNQVRQMHRRIDVVEIRDGALLDDQEETTEPGVEERLAGREESAQLAQRIRELPPRQREVLDLRLNHELSHGEIGELLGITPENSRANYYQALRSLRRRYGEEDREPASPSHETER
jgi:RNA polymerase sigma-70 factor (ECF subfamily)